MIERALSDANEEMRLAAVLWAGEEQVRQVAAALPRALAGGNVAPELLRAYTAAAERLGKSGSTGASQPALTEVMIFPVTNAARPLNLSLTPRQSSTAAKPSSDADWRKALSMPGNVVSGKRLFYDASIGCAQFHRV